MGEGLTYEKLCEIRDRFIVRSMFEDDEYFYVPWNPVCKSDLMSSVSGQTMWGCFDE